jgi:hypothetical protein
LGIPKKVRNDAGHPVLWTGLRRQWKRATTKWLLHALTLCRGQKSSELCAMLLLNRVPRNHEMLTTFLITAKKISFKNSGAGFSKPANDALSNLRRILLLFGDSSARWSRPWGGHRSPRSILSPVPFFRRVGHVPIFRRPIARRMCRSVLYRLSGRPEKLVKTRGS